MTAHSHLGPILEKVRNGDPLIPHEKAVITYLSLVFRDFKIETNSDLELHLERVRFNATV